MKPKENVLLTEGPIEMIKENAVAEQLLGKIQPLGQTSVQLKLLKY